MYIYIYIISDSSYVHNYNRLLSAQNGMVSYAKTSKVCGSGEMIRVDKNMGMGQNPIPLVNIKIARKWMFIPLKMVCIGIDP